MVREYLNSKNLKEMKEQADMWKNFLEQKEKTLQRPRDWEHAYCVGGSARRLVETEGAPPNS